MSVTLIKAELFGWAEQEARNWVADVAPEGYAFRASFPKIIGYIQRQYEGGWAEFVRQERTAIAEMNEYLASQISEADAFGAVESGFVESDEQPEKLIIVDEIEPGMDVRVNYRGELIEGTIDSAFDHDESHMSLGIALPDRDVIRCIIMRGTDPVIWRL